MATKSFKTKIGLTPAGYTVYFSGEATEQSLTENDIKNNISRVRVKLTGTVAAGSASDNNTKVVLNSKTVYNGAATITSSGKVFYDDIITVEHNATTGAATYTLSASITMSYLGYSGSDKVVLTLTTIPRASSITSIDGGSYLGDVQTVKISRASTSFTHQIEWKFGNNENYRTESNAAGTSKELSISLGSATYIPTSTSGTLTVRVTTFNDGEKIGDPVTKTKTLKLPTDVVPTINSITATRVDNSVPESWDVYVQNNSKVKIDVSATRVYGSDIKSYKIEGPGLTASTASGTSNVIPSSGEATYTVTVTDARGRKATASTSIDVIPYAKPSVNVAAVRCNSSGTPSTNGTYLLVTANYSYHSVSGHNSITSQLVQCNGISKTTFTNGVPFILAANCSIGNKYVLEASVTDALGNTSPPTTIDILSAERIMNIKANKKGVAFGKFSEKDNTVESAWKVEVNTGNTTNVDIEANGKIKASEFVGNVLADDISTTDMTVSNIINTTGINATNSSFTNLTVNGRKFGANKELWTGEYYMTSGQTATLKEAVSAQPNGIVLVWSYYNSGAAQDQYFNFTFIPKSFVGGFTSNGVACWMIGSTTNIVTSKYVYINDTSVTGYSGNNADASTTNASITISPKAYVLRKVIGV